MQAIISKPISKAIIDIALFVGIFVSIISSRQEGAASWGSFHCIASMTWYALMLVHIWQHWKLTKAFVKPKVMWRNKITFITIIMFVLITFSIIPFVFDVNDRTVHIHHDISHVFKFVMIVHAIQKAKSFAKLFKGTRVLSAAEVKEKAKIVVLEMMKKSAIF